MRLLCSASLIWLALCACSPALDWREVSPSGLGIAAVFPCRPASRTREIRIGLQRVEMALHACIAQGATFAISSALIADVRDVGPALAQLSAAAASNLGVPLESGEALQVPGMTPHEYARRFRLEGTRPDGALVVEHMAVFARGARIYQAFVVAVHPDAEAVQTFFASLRLVA